MSDYGIIITQKDEDMMDEAITKLTAIRQCEMDNPDVHDHYDCRNDLERVRTIVNELLQN